MKKIYRIIAVIMASLTLIASSTAIAGAARVSVVKCYGKNCDNIGSFINNTIKSSCKKTLKSTKGYCPDGNCSTKKPVKNSASSVKTPAASSSQSAEFNEAYEAKVLELVNTERNKNGLFPLKKDTGAVNVAHLRAKEIVTAFSHTRPDGSSCFTAARELGVSYRAAGENIAYGYSTPEQVVKGWMNSEGHRKNILSSSFSKIGIGCYKSGNVLYWSQFFIG